MSENAEHSLSAREDLCMAADCDGLASDIGWFWVVFGLFQGVVAGWLGDWVVQCASKCVKQVGETSDFVSQNTQVILKIMHTHKCIDPTDMFESFYQNCRLPKTRSVHKS